MMLFVSPEYTQFAVCSTTGEFEYVDLYLLL